MASANDSMADRIDGLVGEKQGKLTSLAFETDDIETAHHVLTRRGLRLANIENRTSDSIVSGERRSWRSFRCPDEGCAGVKTFIVQTDQDKLSANSPPPGGITSLDHLVINTPNPERCAAHYGARLGLRRALDRTIDAFKTRFLFFRVGELTLEIIHRLDQTCEPDDPDKIWGLTWAVDDLLAAHARLTDLGLDISPIRKGRKPGSEVFTLRNKTMDIPTLFIAHTPKDRK